MPNDTDQAVVPTDPALDALVRRLSALTVDCECTDGWGGAVPDIEDAIKRLCRQHAVDQLPAPATHNAAIAAAVRAKIALWANGDDPEMLMRELAAVMVGGGDDGQTDAK